MVSIPIIGNISKVFVRMNPPNRVRLVEHRKRCSDTEIIMINHAPSQFIPQSVIILAVSWLLGQTFAEAADIYAIGDKGPAGGVVFYVTDGGLHGLEAAPADSAISPWGCVGIDIPGADGNAIGTGAHNTAEIVAGCADRGSAARIVNSYSLNGFDDWFLPSKDELNQLRIERSVVGGFTDGYYRSSSEYNGDLAWSQYFLIGSQGISSKDYAGSVRAVRAF